MWCLIRVRRHNPWAECSLPLRMAESFGPIRGYILLSVDLQNSDPHAQIFEVLPPFAQQQKQAKMPPITAKQQRRINARPK